MVIRDKKEKNQHGMRESTWWRKMVILNRLAEKGFTEKAPFG